MSGSERHRNPEERCEAAAEAALGAVGTECLRRSVGDVAEDLEGLTEVYMDTAGTSEGGDFAFIDLTVKKEGSEEVFNLLRRNGFTIHKIRASMTGFPTGEKDIGIHLTARRPEELLAIGLPD